ncbi:sporulation membrane protein YtrI [Salirhabdus sp. Marseille-P4669]|uniref:sporulation membrane protein YtrI n=1 Tax=Salirhabdus sp. Marseille-P4669 TaxID=2042310 RepID=UPI000C7C1576|nr:sporulation membrane protein YtrI [Salirhabdus sp. Marseille-P4669]
MHIPPYYKRRGTQYFFVGMLVGAILAYLFFLYINGKLTERWIEQTVELRSEIVQLEDRINGLTKDKENLSKENKEMLTVQEINIEISNKEQLKLDSIEAVELTARIQKELSPLIGNSIESLSENRSLIYSTLENKSFQMNNFSYQPSITELIIATKMEIKIKLSMTN